MYKLKALPSFLVHLLLGVSAAGPVPSDGHCPHRHQEDDHHVVIQHRLIGRVHGDQSSFTESLQQLEALLVGVTDTGKLIFQLV